MATIGSFSAKYCLSDYAVYPFSLRPVVLDGATGVACARDTAPVDEHEEKCLHTILWAPMVWGPK